MMKYGSCLRHSDFFKCFFIHGLKPGATILIGPTALVVMNFSNAFDHGLKPAATILIGPKAMVIEHLSNVFSGGLVAHV
jgi:hypothetical protein